MTRRKSESASAPGGQRAAVRYRRAEHGRGGGAEAHRAAVLTIAAIGVAVFALVASAATAAERGEPLDLDTLRRIPVFADRMMPLDTFARRLVQSICGRERPTLGLDGAAEPGEPDAALAEARAILPGGAWRRFDPVELLLSWLVEPERWQRIPFLVAEHKQLREEILQLPPRDARGRRLRHVSPSQVEQSRRLAERWDDLLRRWRAEGEGFELSGVDRKVKELLDAHTAFRGLTFDPADSAASHHRFRDRFERVRQSWGKLAAAMKSAGRLGNDDPSGRLLVELGKSLGALAAAADAQPLRLEALDAAAAELSRLAADAQHRFAAEESPALAHLAADLRRETIELHRALYDGGGTLRLVPALSLSALEATRTPDDDAPPWLSLQSLLRGSPALLADDPAAEVAEVRAAWDALAAAYTDRAAPDRPEQFRRAAERWAAALRRLGEAVEPARRALPLAHRDEAILAATAYPPPGATDEEVFYNQLDPFFWAWLVNLGALAALALSFGALSRPMFWLGLAALLLGQGFVLAGLGLRWHITGLAPLTGMFETVVISALCVALMGAAFTLLPLVSGGVRLGWRLTALPHTPEATPWQSVLPEGASPTPWAVAGAVFAPLRVAAAAGVALSLARVPGVWEGGRFGYFSALPRADASGMGYSANSLIVWVVSLVVLLAAVYLLPRLVGTMAASMATVPYQLWRAGLGASFAQVMARKPFALVGAAVALLAALLAYYAPETVLSREITSTRPVLRDNFWLFVHVLTITASYAAGALAWGLANISLAYYLFGRYRPAAEALAADDQRGAPTTAETFAPAAAEDAMPAAARCLPPEPCAALAGFTYRAIQVAVLLLAAGTILGALWADKAWGRFWSWDAKEVFSLVSLLVYMAVLHARYVGWSGNFGLAVGAVLGMTFIMIAWYGVNFIFGSGLHSYGSGAGGQTPVVIAVVANWIFVGFAATRYLGESRRSA